MIKEFAIDPELFCQWDHHLVLRSQFGVDKGRLVADFPRKWKRLLAEATNELEASGGLLPVKAQTVRNWIGLFTGQTDPRFVRRGWNYNGDKSWRLNAEEQASEFDVLLSHRGIDSPNALLTDAGMCYLENTLFAATTQIRVRREKGALVDSMWPLIRASSGPIKIIEPNFNPVETRFMKPFVELLDRLTSRGSSIRDVELHVLRSDEFSLRTIHNCRTHIDKELRTGYRVTVFFWGNKLEQLHDRYLLTNRGGIEINFGWDEGKLESETTPVTILAPEMWRQEWSRYCVGCADFDLDALEHVWTIGGT